MASLVKADKSLDESCKLALVVNTLNYSSIEGFNVKRNCNEMSGLMLLELLEDILNTRGNVNITADRVLSVNRNRRAVGVMRGKHVHTLNREVDERNNVCKVGHKVSLREHNALALSGSTRGEHELCKCIGINLCVVVSRGVLTELLCTCLAPSEKAVLTLTVKVKGCGNSKRVCNELSLFRDINVAHKEVALTVLYCIEKVLLGPVSVERNPHAARSHNRIVALNQGIGVLADNGNLLALVSSCDNLGRKCANVITHLVVGDLDCLFVVRLVAVAVSNLTVISFTDILYHFSDVSVFSLFS